MLDTKDYVKKYITLQKIKGNVSYESYMGNITESILFKLVRSFENNDAFGTVFGILDSLWNIECLLFELNINRMGISLVETEYDFISTIIHYYSIIRQTYYANDISKETKNDCLYYDLIDLKEALLEYSNFLKLPIQKLWDDYYVECKINDLSYTNTDKNFED